MTIAGWNVIHPFYKINAHRLIDRGLLVLCENAITANEIHYVHLDNECLLRTFDKHEAEFMYRLECGEE